AAYKRDRRLTAFERNSGEHEHASHALDAGEPRALRLAPGLRDPALEHLVVIVQDLRRDPRPVKLARLLLTRAPHIGTLLGIGEKPTKRVGYSPRILSFHQEAFDPVGQNIPISRNVRG